MRRRLKERALTCEWCGEDVGEWLYLEMVCETCYQKRELGEWLMTMCDEKVWEEIHAAIEIAKKVMDDALSQEIWDHLARAKEQVERTNAAFFSLYVLGVSASDGNGFQEAAVSASKSFRP